MRSFFWRRFLRLSHHYPFLFQALRDCESGLTWNCSDRLENQQMDTEQHAPPKDIWSGAEIPFTRDCQFVRVNTQQSWIQAKLRLDLRMGAILIIALGLSLTACAPLTVDVWNPLNFKGPEFLRFYLILVGISTGLAYYLRLRLQQPVDISLEELPQLNVYETAYLAEGNYRAINTAIVSLIQRGHLTLLPKIQTLVFANELPEDSYTLERTIMQAIEIDGRILSVRLSVLTAVEPISQSLRDLGLLLTDNQIQIFRYCPTVIVFAVLLLGITKFLLGISPQQVVIYLIMVCSLVV
ncbi:MAG: TIGR04222 domain-containing membrane protein [Leptolyngbyaceae cyanobacterium MO_188.B28]|nr:TIGR04222 domain-containing membrane protein [Leptolyngbyaceae cyanobacterium MO_188.B28]